MLENDKHQQMPFPRPAPSSSFQKNAKIFVQFKENPPAFWPVLTHKMPSLSGIFLSLVYTFFGIEMLTNVIVFGIVCLNLAVISPTPLLHPNLKSILITQSVAVGLYVVTRSVMLFQKFVSNDPFTPANLILQSVLTFDALFRRLLGHALIIERLIATVCTKSYEKLPKFYFNFAWLSVTFTIAFVNTITNEQSWTFTLCNVITASVSTLLSFIEYFMITVIGYYNRKIYSWQIEEASPSNYHIGQRYQISNNMKISSQLSAAFLCLILSNLSMNFMFVAVALDVFREGYQKSLLFAVYTWIDALFGATIELIIITHHPLLKKRFATLLKSIFCFKRNQIGTVPNSVVLLAVCPGNGGDEMTAVHFNMLKQLWNK